MEIMNVHLQQKQLIDLKTELEEQAQNEEIAITSTSHPRIVSAVINIVLHLGSILRRGIGGTHTSGRVRTH